VKIYAPKKDSAFRLVAAIELYRTGRILAARDALLRGKPPEVMKFGTAWQGANIELIDKTTEIAPALRCWRLCVRRPRHAELKMSLAVNTSDGVVLVVGCSHPESKRSWRRDGHHPKIRLIAGGFHLVAAPDEVIARAVQRSRTRFKVESIAPGHCTGEPTFAALKQAYGDRYLYAGVGTTLALDRHGSVGRRGEGRRSRR